MQPEGTAIVNTGYITQLTARVNAISGTGACAELQSAVNAGAASIQADLTAIRTQIAALSPLITPPTSLGAVIAWIGHFSNPLIAASNTYIAQLTAVLAAVTDLETAIANAAARLTSCTITIPPMT